MGKVDRKGGPLAVPEANEIIPIINDLLKYKWKTVIATQDYHPEGHISFASTHGRRPYEEMTTKFGAQEQRQVLWPNHCIQDTRGCELHERINREAIDQVVQ